MGVDCNDSALSKIMNAFRNIVYIKVDDESVYVKDVISNDVLEEKNIIGIENKTNLVCAVGDHSPALPNNYSDITFSKVFESVISSMDPDLAAAGLKYFLRKVKKRKVLVRPTIIFSFPKRIESITKEDVINLEKIGEKAGAKEVYLWQGSELDSYQILNKDFPGNHWVGKSIK